MKKLSALTLCLILSSQGLLAHAGVFGSEDNSSSIDKGAARTVNKVLKGVVVQVSDAKIEESKDARGTGAMAGAGVGGAVGSTASGRGSIVGGILGAVAGGLAGAAVSSAVASQKAQDILIQLENNADLINITQAVDDKVGTFNEGDAVLIIYKGDSARVIRNKIGQKQASPATVPAPASAPQNLQSDSTAAAN